MDSANGNTSGNQIDALFKAYYRELCIFAFQIVEDMDASEDLVQDVFSRCITQHVQMSEIDNPRAYLYKAVRNASLKHLKKQAPLYRVDHLVNEILDTYDVERFIIEIERKMEIYRAIDSLPEQCRKIFINCQINQLKYRETAEELNISVNSVKTQMKKALRLLREALKDVYSLYVSFLLVLFCLI